MSPPRPEHDQPHPHFDLNPNVRRHWPWFLALGLAVLALGVGAIVYTFAATLTTVIAFGILLVVGGVVQVVNAFLARRWRGFFLFALVGVLHLIVGGVMIDHPLRAAEALTAVLAVGFLIAGSARLIFAAANSFDGRGWVLVNGLVVLLMGVSIWRGWPESSLWVIGLFVGIDLVCCGWSWLTIGLAARSVARLAGRAARPLAGTAATR